jgi:arylsulfatase A-like enzyme
MLAAAAIAAASAPLNFVFILADDLGWADISPNNPNTFYETPYLQQMADAGMRLTNAYAACPVCSPTRSSIMTGRYPARTANTDWFGAPQPETASRHHTRHKPLLPAPYIPQMVLEELTIAESLKKAGYSTFFAGKWHLGGEGFFPEDQGFDINVGGHHRGSPPGGYFAPYSNPKMESGPDGEHLTKRLGDETASFIRSAEGPFFAYLSLYAVHTPLQGREDLVKKYRARREDVIHEGPRFIPEGERQARQVQDHAVYAAMVESMDAAVGTVMRALKEKGVAENTAIIFFSDNGGLSTSEGSPTSNLPLRAGKGWLYEGGIREPALVVWPGQIKPGSVSDLPVTSTDFFPTMLEMAGLPSEPQQHLDGRSMVSALKGGQGEERALYWHYPHYGNQGGSPGSAIRVGDWKLILWDEEKNVELFNLRSDIGEQNNVAKSEPFIAYRLLTRLQAWKREVGARNTSPNPNRRD